MNHVGEKAKDEPQKISGLLMGPEHVTRPTTLQTLLLLLFKLSIKIAFIITKLFVCKCVLPPGHNPIAVNKYIISKYGYQLFSK